jgi:integrase
MQDTIKVYVIDKGRKYLYLKYLDPVTGRPVEKSAKTAKHAEALKEAGKWQDELRTGRYQKAIHMSWESFRDFYGSNCLPSVAATTAVTYEATLNVFERTCNPQKLSSVTTPAVTRFASALRQQELSEATIGRHLRQLKVILRWAQGQGLLNTLPTFNMPRRTKGAKSMRGRAVTEEEFDRMLAAAPKVVENAAAASWRFYLRGLWLSGLRLSESLSLRWDDAPGVIVVDFSGRRPMLRIPSEAQKARRDTLLPMTPDFAALLQSVPEGQRLGRVFKLLAVDGSPMAASRFMVGPVVSAIGEAAGVVVDERQKGGKTVRKFASAHDLRRAFGVRWAARVMPNDLRELMRHTDVGTTMKFYVGQNAESTADRLWATFVDTLVDTSDSANLAESRTA